MTTITQVITALPVAPDPLSMTQTEFSAAATASLAAQKAMTPELNILSGQINAVAAEINAHAISISSISGIDKVAENTVKATSMASSASSSAILAQAAWTAALAANPGINPSVRMNPSTIAEDLTIPSFYNAYSAGPLSIAEGINATIGDDANWDII